MHTLQHRQQHIIKIIFLFVGIFAATLSAATFAQTPAYALPVTVLAASQGDSCALPDGSSDGVIGKDNLTCCPVKYSNDSLGCLYAKYLNPAIALLSAIMGLVVVIAIVYGAFEYTTSNGDPQRAAAGRQKIINALLGLVAFILLYTFLQFIVPGGFLNG